VVSSGSERCASGPRARWAIGSSTNVPGAATGTCREILASCSPWGPLCRGAVDEPGRVIHTVRMRRGVVLAGLACMLVGALLDRRGLGGWDLDSDLDRLAACAAAVLAAAGLLALAPSRNARVLAAIVAAATAVPGALAVAGAVESGLPGPSTGVLAVGSAVVVLGAAARAFEREHPAADGARRPLRVALVGAATVVVTAVGAAAASAAVVEAPVRAATAAPAAPEQVVTRPGTVRWAWDADGPVADVRAAGAGVVVAGGEAVTALDGPSGAERWEFARTGARVVDLVVSPDRASVVVVHAGTADSGVAVLTTLDAFTGQRRWETVVDRHAALLLTDAVVAVVAYREPPDDAGDAGLVGARLTAYDLRTGDPTWTWESPPGCGAVPLRSLEAVRVVPVEAECPDGVVLHGLDERTGQDAWSLPLRPYAPAAATGYGMRTTGGGAFVVADGPDASHLVVEAATGRVAARLDTGAFPLPAADGRVQLRAGEPERVVAAVDPATGAVVPVPPGCTREAAAAVTGEAVLRLCHGERYLDLQVDTGAPVPLDLLPGDPSAALDLLGHAFVVPAPGAVAVAVASRSGSVVGLA
jgi:outer membrane protein assembly factor BamB